MSVKWRTATERANDTIEAQQMLIITNAIASSFIAVPVASEIDFAESQ